MARLSAQWGTAHRETVSGLFINGIIYLCIHWFTYFLLLIYSCVSFICQEKLHMDLFAYYCIYLQLSPSAVNLVFSPLTAFCPKSLHITSQTHVRH